MKSSVFFRWINIASTNIITIDILTNKNLVVTYNFAKEKDPEEILILFNIKCLGRKKTEDLMIFGFFSGKMISVCNWYPTNLNRL